MMRQDFRLVVRSLHRLIRMNFISYGERDGVVWIFSKSKFIPQPSPPGLLAHPWVPGGGPYHAPLLYREPLVVESRARWHSKDLHKTHPKLLNEFKIEVTCKVKVRSTVKIRCFDVLGPGDQDYRTWWLKLRQNVVKGIVKVWYEYKWHTKKMSRLRSGHKRSLYVRIVIKSDDTCLWSKFDVELETHG